MIPKPYGQVIELGDIQSLIDNAIRESRTIDYKRDPPGKAERDRVHFLNDISAMANTSGGDIVYGIRENAGLPVEIIGIATDDPDAEVCRLENMARSGLEPRLPGMLIHTVSVATDRFVLVVRLRRSWIGPHRVISSAKFYGRNSAGNYPMDVGELRTAFTLSDTINEKIHRFVTERLISVAGNETPVPCEEGPRVVLHLIPQTALSDMTSVDVYADKLDAALKPLDAGGWSHRLNLEGMVTFSGSPMSDAYTQLFRSGIVEAVAVLGKPRGSINPHGLEAAVLSGVPAYLGLLERMDVALPIVVFISLVGVKGCSLAADPRVMWRQPHPMNRDNVLLPELLLDGFSADLPALLEPTFEVFWNASGLRRPSRNR